MKRFELISSDEYVKAHIECIIRSGRPVNKMRPEMDKFIIDLKNELIHSLKQSPPASGQEKEDELKMWDEFRDDMSRGLSWTELRTRYFITKKKKE